VHIFEIKGDETPIFEVNINSKVTHLAWSPHEDVIAVVGKD